MWATVVVVLVMAAMVYGAYVLEPHWVSKDGERMMVYAQLIDRHHQPEGRWREVRMARLPDGTWHISHRKRVTVKTLPTTVWTPQGRLESPKKSRAQFLFRGRNQDGSQALLVVRVPARSRAVTILTADNTQP
jgi:hypothetical protein